MERKKQPQYLIVIDPSPNCTGWAIFEISKKPALINYGIINNNHYTPVQIGEKLNHIEMTLQVLRNTYYPHVIVKEAWVNSPGSGFKTALVHGIVAKVFTHVEIIEINNKEFKKDFAGTGNAEKDDVAASVQKYRKVIWHKTKPLVFKTDDESDAVGIGCYWLIQNDLLQEIV